MTEIILLKIALLGINLYFAYMHNELRNYKTSIFSSFTSGALFADLLETFLK